MRNMKNFDITDLDKKNSEQSNISAVKHAIYESKYGG